ncbi:MAG: GNAT family N-acetyltransferase, partial [Candidatus Zixiibacteriota bacterium]
METKKLTAEMLQFRLGHDPDIDPDWFVAHLNDVIRFNPDGCFALVDGDDVTGMITSTVYQQVGWLGWLFVLEEYRQRGLGAQLMEKGIEHIRSRDIKTVLLEADLKAIPLYERLGFVEHFNTQHFTLTRGDFKCGHRIAAQVASIARDDLNAIADFDRGFFHEDRLGLFETVVSNPTFRGFAATKGGKMAGYIFVTEATENQQVSPLIVDLSHEHAEEVAG